MIRLYRAASVAWSHALVAHGAIPFKPIIARRCFASNAWEPTTASMGEKGEARTRRRPPSIGRAGGEVARDPIGITSALGRLLIEGVVEVALGLAVALFHRAFALFQLAFDDVALVVGHLAPALLNLAGELVHRALALVFRAALVQVTIRVQV